MLTDCFVFYFRNMIKRLASLFLLTTLFYNVLGYYFLYQHQKEQNWIASIEKQEPSDYKILKLNASIYTFMEDTEFEYVNETVVINFSNCHIFKKRIQNNVLYLYYLPNTHQNQISKNLSEIVNQQLFDNSTSKDSPAKKIIKTFITDYVVQDPLACNLTQTLFGEVTHQAGTSSVAIADGFFQTPYSPPDLV